MIKRETAKYCTNNGRDMTKSEIEYLGGSIIEPLSDNWADMYRFMKQY